MPSHRRRPTSHPGRRTTVAGLRKPGAKPSPSPRPKSTPYSAQQEDLVGAEETSVEEGIEAEATEEEATETARAGEETGDTDVEPAATETAHAEAEDAETEAVAAKPRPSPKPKTRDTGVAKPTTPDEAETPAEEQEPTVTTAGRPSGGGEKTLIGAALVIGVVFSVAAALFAWQFFGVKSTTSNKAMSDAVGTSQVKEEINTAIENLLSYSYKEIDEHEKTAKEILHGDKVRKQFDRLYGDVKEKAPKQKLVLTTKVSYSSTIEMTDDSAKLLLFVEQSAKREGTDQESAGGGMLKVTAVKKDDKWVIGGLDTYGEMKKPAKDDGKGDKDSGSGDEQDGEKQPSGEDGDGDKGGN